MKSRVSTLLYGLFWACAAPCLAHPLPDVPVRADFAQDGGWTLQVEVDPRCFEEDPNVALSVTNADLALFTAERKEQLKTAARDYVKRVVEIVLDPAAPVNPEFVFGFTTHENAPLKTPEDAVVLTGTWKTKVPAGTTGYSIKALQTGELSVLYHNTALGKKLDRFQILFPGESSYVLDLKTFTPRTAAPPPITADTPQDNAEALPAMDCPMCEAVSGGGYLLPAVASVAGIVFLVTWLRKKRA
ncbi:MAG: hypothetical protein Q8M07_10980 [Prosthecobacter sp.]|nr:hypothetical protein [Prosthecobacter sp.]